LKQVQKEILNAMKTYPSLALAALLAAAPLLAGCENSSSGPPKADTTQTIQSGNSPTGQPGESRRPGQPGAAPTTGSTAPGSARGSTPARAGR